MFKQTQFDGARIDNIEEWFLPTTPMFPIFFDIVGI